MDFDLEMEEGEFEISASGFVSRSLDHSLLSEREELNLLERAQHGDEEAVEALVQGNQRLIAVVAQRYFRHNETNEVEFCDLVQAGNIGLLKAIRMWDAGRNVKFDTYAYWWIRAYIRRLSLHRSTSLSVSFGFSEKLVTLRKARNNLLRDLGREPTAAELADYTGLAKEVTTTGLMAIQQTISLQDDSDDPDCDESSAARVLADCEQNTEEAAFAKVLASQAISYIAELPDKWQLVIRRRFGLDSCEPRSQKEVADELGISRQAVLKIERHALRKIRASVMFAQR